MKKALSALLVAAATVSATVVGIAAPAQAALGGCTTTVSTTPYIGVTVINAAPTWEQVRVCVGVSTVAYEEFEVRVHPFGGGGFGSCGTPDNYTGVGTDWATNPGYIGANGGVGFSATPQACSYPDGSYKVVVSGRVCAGAGCVPVGETGAIVGVFRPSVLPGGALGAGYTLHGTYIVANNTLIGIGPSHDTYVWVTPNTVSLAEQNALCLLGVECVPSSIRYNGGALLTIQVISGPPVTVTVPGGSRCIPLYQIGTNPVC